MIQNRGVFQYSQMHLVRPPKSRMEQVKILFEHRAARRQFASQKRIPSVLLEDKFPCIAQKRAIIQSAVRTEASFGNMPNHELVILSTLCAIKQPKTVFEFGTYDGLTTLHFAINSPEEARIFTIDLAPDDPIRKMTTDDTYYTQGVTVGDHFQNCQEASKITQIWGDTTRYDHSALVGKVDMIFVDAGHTYDLVKSDTEKALAMLAPGGMVFWHDYQYTIVGVYLYLNELSESLPLFHLEGTALVGYVRPGLN